MFSKNEILSKIENLQSYCETNRQPNVSGNFASFLQPLRSAINEYFNDVPNGLKYDLMKYITQIYMDLQKRQTTYEHHYGSDPSTDYPEGYMDLGEIFGNGAFDEIMEISGAEFLAGFPTVSDELSSTSHYESNPIIETWITSIETAHGSESSKIQNIIDFCERNVYNDGLISLFEDRGKITIHTTKEELANDIYITKGAKLVIQNFNLDVYIPSYI